MERISVIIPVYNSAKYLVRCLESVKKQTYSEIEMIIVDDGSTDNSYQICLEYKNERMKLIRTDNQGVSNARKEAIKYATGTIIAFVDSDDWIEPQMIEKMYQEMIRHNVDIVVAGYMERFDGKENQVFNKLEAGVYQGKCLEETIFSKMLCCEEFFELGIQPYLWNKLYRREVIETYIVSLNKKVVVGEDVLCVYPAILKATGLSIIKEAYYHYCIHKQSAMRKFRSEKVEVENIQMQYQELKKIFVESPYQMLLMPQLKRYILHHFMVRAMGYLNGIVDKTWQSIFEKMELGSKIIIYGAGTFGVSLYRFWESEPIYEILAWCDRDYKRIQAMGYPVISVEDALCLTFDYIVIAVLNEKTAKDIRKMLVLKNIENDRIIWLNTQLLYDENLIEKITAGKSS